MICIIEFLQYGFISFYFILVLILFVYSLHRFSLTIWFHMHKSKSPHQLIAPLNLPIVTIQLPLYNEQYVVRRLLQSIKNLDYPRDHLEVQILDDSTDDTQKIAQQMVYEMQLEGINICYVHRPNRIGYKAGALSLGLKKAKGEFIAIFDADFCPDKQFLLKTIPYFRNFKVGMVQGRWGHLNREYSLLTKLQAIYLDAHFVVEHVARSRSEWFFNFNGTGGIWRRECLISSGGWHADTLTEDLDISYRAQLEGWHFIYLTDLVVPSELPVQMNSFKSQQYRWVKGSIQTAMKLLSPVLKSGYPWRTKMEAFFHLTGNIVYLPIVFLSLSILPIIIIRSAMDCREGIWIDIPLLLAASLSFMYFYMTAEKVLHPNSYLSRLFYFPLLMGLGVGISLNNARAILSALLKRDSEFRRTPKHGIKDHSGSWKNSEYFNRIDYAIVGELFVLIYLVYSFYLAIVNEIYFAIPSLLLFEFGFAYVFVASLFESSNKLLNRSIPAL